MANSDRGRTVSPTVGAFIGLALSAFLAGCGQRPDDQDPRRATQAVSTPYRFLVRDGVGTEQSARAYYATIGAQPTLDGWKSANGFDRLPIHGGNFQTDVYRNTVDLGFVREMRCTQSLGRGLGGCYVRNWRSFDDYYNQFQNPSAAVGTVAMNVSPEGYTRFYAYDSNGNLSPGVALDSEGVKYVPQVCTVCHGGNVTDGNPDLGALFREFEPSALDGSYVNTKYLWYALNYVTRLANGAVRSEGEGSPFGTDAAKESMLSYNLSIYPGADPTVFRSVRDPAHVPPSWNGSTASQRLFENLVNPYCQGCHRSNSRNFSDYANFVGLWQNRQLAHYLQGDDARLYAMPQSQLANGLVNADQTAIGAMNDWLASNPYAGCTSQVCGGACFAGSGDVNGSGTGCTLRGTNTALSDIGDLGAEASGLVRSALANGWMTPCSGDASGASFCPHETVTRGEAATILVRGLYGDDFSLPSNPWVPTDVASTDWRLRYIQKAYDLHITHGTSDSTFSPDTPMTRGQMAALIVRTWSIHNGSDAEGFPGASCGNPLFGDVPRSDGFYAYVQKLRELGITSGTSEDPLLYGPGGSSERWQVAVFIMRALGGATPAAAPCCPNVECTPSVCGRTIPVSCTNISRTTHLACGC